MSKLTDGQLATLSQFAHRGFSNEEILVWAKTKIVLPKRCAGIKKRKETKSHVGRRDHPRWYYQGIIDLLSGK